MPLKSHEHGSRGWPSAEEDAEDDQDQRDQGVAERGRRQGPAHGEQLPEDGAQRQHQDGGQDDRKDVLRRRLDRVLVLPESMVALVSAASFQAVLRD